MRSQRQAGLRDPADPAPPRAPRGSVLIIVLWVAFGLVSIALYFAHSMSFELRAADNRVAALEAEQAIAGAARYLSNLLATVQTNYPGTLPEVGTYLDEAVPVGNAKFWLIGRTDEPRTPDRPFCSLTDEAGKLNLNTATADTLQWLPGMTPELAAAIVDWRDSDSEPTSGGAENDVYQRLNPPYRCKNAPFESVEELRLVYGFTRETLYGEDANGNGILDPNENDGDATLPLDNRDGRLNPGVLEYVTVFSREPNVGTNGTARVNVSGGNAQTLATLLQGQFGVDRANQILLAVGGGASGGGGGGPGGGGTNTTLPTYSSLLQFYARSGMTEDEFDQIGTELTTASGTVITGKVNVATASAAVLSCLPGIGLEYGPAVAAFRQSNPARLRSIAWVAEVLGQTNAIQAGPYLTAYTYQSTADIAAVGHYGRGYQRTKLVFDASDGTQRVVYRQDQTALGWALGKETRNALRLLAKEQR